MSVGFNNTFIEANYQIVLHFTCFSLFAVKLVSKMLS